MYGVGARMPAATEARRVGVAAAAGCATTSASMSPRSPAAGVKCLVTMRCMIGRAAGGRSERHELLRELRFDHTDHRAGHGEGGREASPGGEQAPAGGVQGGNDGRVRSAREMC